MKLLTPLAAGVFLAGAAIIPIQKGLAQMNAETQAHPYVGMWVTGDGHVRQELLPNGRYDEARGNRRSAYQGRYEVRGDYIFYWDDTGFTADGTFVDDVLHHGGMIFYREEQERRSNDG